MTVKTTGLGGEDWDDGDVLFAADQNATFAEAQKFYWKNIGTFDLSSFTPQSADYFIPVDENIGVFLDASEGTINYTDDAGANWAVKETNAALDYLNVNEGNTNYLICWGGAANATYYSTDGGINWTQVTDPTNKNSSPVYTACAISDSGRVYMGYRDSSGSDVDFNLDYTDNDGVAWTNIQNVTPGGGASVNVTQSVIAETDDMVAYTFADNSNDYYGGHTFNNGGAWEVVTDSNDTYDIYYFKVLDADNYFLSTVTDTTAADNIYLDGNTITELQTIGLGTGLPLLYYWDFDNGNFGFDCVNQASPYNSIFRAILLSNTTGYPDKIEFGGSLYHCTAVNSGGNNTVMKTDGGDFVGCHVHSSMENIKTRFGSPTANNRTVLFKLMRL